MADSEPETSRRTRLRRLRQQSADSFESTEDSSSSSSSCSSRSHHTTEPEQQRMTEAEVLKSKKRRKNREELEKVMRFIDRGKARARRLAKFEELRAKQREIATEEIWGWGPWVPGMPMGSRRPKSVLFREYKFDRLTTHGKWSDDALKAIIHLEMRMEELQRERESQERRSSPHEVSVMHDRANCESLDCKIWRSETEHEKLIQDIIDEDPLTDRILNMFGQAEVRIAKDIVRSGPDEVARYTTPKSVPAALATPEVIVTRTPAIESKSNTDTSRPADAKAKQYQAASLESEATVGRTRGESAAKTQTGRQPSSRPNVSIHKASSVRPKPGPSSTSTSKQEEKKKRTRPQARMPTDSESDPYPSQVRAAIKPARSEPIRSSKKRVRAIESDCDYQEVETEKIRVRKKRNRSVTGTSEKNISDGQALDGQTLTLHVSASGTTRSGEAASSSKGKQRAVTSTTTTTPVLTHLASTEKRKGDVADICRGDRGRKDKSKKGGVSSAPPTALDIEGRDGKTTATGSRNIMTADTSARASSGESPGPSTRRNDIGAGSPESRNIQSNTGTATASATKRNLSSLGAFQDLFTLKNRRKDPPESMPTPRNIQSNAGTAAASATKRNSSSLGAFQDLFTLENMRKDPPESMPSPRDNQPNIADSLASTTNSETERLTSMPAPSLSYYKNNRKMSPPERPNHTGSVASTPLNRPLRAQAVTGTDPSTRRNGVAVGSPLASSRLDRASSPFPAIISGTDRLSWFLTPRLFMTKHSSRTSPALPSEVPARSKETSASTANARADSPSRAQVATTSAGPSTRKSDMGAGLSLSPLRDIQLDTASSPVSAIASSMERSTSSSRPILILSTIENTSKAIPGPTPTPAVPARSKSTLPSTTHPRAGTSSRAAQVAATYTPSTNAVSSFSPSYWFVPPATLAAGPSAPKKRTIIDLTSDVEDNVVGEDVRDEGGETLVRGNDDVKRGKKRRIDEC